MASTKEYHDFVMEQLLELDTASLKMMGEYVIYFKGKSLAVFMTTDFL